MRIRTAETCTWVEKFAEVREAVRMFRLVLAEGRSLVRQRDEIEARAVELLSDHADYRLLTSIPSIGPINAMTILAEAGHLRLLRHHPVATFASERMLALLRFSSPECRLGRRRKIDGGPSGPP